MRALVQRVSQASVTVDSQVAGEIGPGLLVFLGVKVGDTPEIAAKLAGKIGALRLFPDEAGKMNRSVRDIDGQVLVVSQFTLYGDTTRGNRPSFTAAARPELARELYEFFIFQLQAADLQVAAGVFQAHMQVHLVNDGPVTLFCSFGE